MDSMDSIKCIKCHHEWIASSEADKLVCDWCGAPGRRIPVKKRKSPTAHGEEQR